MLTVAADSTQQEFEFKRREGIRPGGVFFALQLGAFSAPEWVS